VDKLKQLESFVSIATKGSLTAAAKAEGVAPAIMGRRLDALEERLGVKLLVRTTRRITLTHEGSAFLEDCQRLLADIANAEAAEAALPYRKRTEAQLRRSFEPLASHIPKEVRNKRKHFVQKHQRAWNRANPTPLTSEVQRALTAEFVKTYAKTTRS
jgi:DNA-binding transcriptional LysR family regulator